MARGGGGHTAQLAPNLGMGKEAGREPGEGGVTGWGQRRDEKRCSCWREIRDLGASGKQDGPALTQRQGGPVQNSSLLRVLGLLLSASASGSRSCPPVPCPP